MTQISGITLYQPTQYIWFIIHNPQIRYPFFKFVFIRVEIFYFKSILRSHNLMRFISKIEVSY